MQMKRYFALTAGTDNHFRVLVAGTEEQDMKQVETEAQMTLAEVRMGVGLQVENAAEAEALYHNLIIADERNFKMFFPGAWRVWMAYGQYHHAADISTPTWSIFGTDKMLDAPFGISEDEE